MRRTQRTKSAVHEALQCRATAGPALALLIGSDPKFYEEWSGSIPVLMCAHDAAQPVELTKRRFRGFPLVFASGRSESFLPATLVRRHVLPLLRPCIR
jgi:hypothetical protein